MTFVGPALGLVVSGFLQLKETWRSTFYVLLWMASLTELLPISLPETLSIIIFRNKASRLRNISRRDGVMARVEASSCSL